MVEHKEIDSRDGHFALRVGSYRQTLEHLKTHKVELLDRPRNKTPWPQIYVLLSAILFLSDVFLLDGEFITWIFRRLSNSL
jgi:hypothetical protein